LAPSILSRNQHFPFSQPSVCENFIHNSPSYRKLVRTWVMQIEWTNLISFANLTDTVAALDEEVILHTCPVIPAFAGMTRSCFRALRTFEFASLSFPRQAGIYGIIENAESMKRKL